MRSPLFALVKKDVKSYFDQPTAYILIVPFVAVLAYVFFSSALLTAEASLRPIFTVDFQIDSPSLPWLLAIFVPAATMRLLAEENRGRDPGAAADSSCTRMDRSPLEVPCGFYLRGVCHSGHGGNTNRCNHGRKSRHWGRGGTVRQQPFPGLSFRLDRVVHVESDSQPDSGVHPGALAHHDPDGHGVWTSSP